MCKSIYLKSSGVFKWKELKEFIYSKEILDIEALVLQQFVKFSVPSSDSFNYRELEKYQPQSVKNLMCYLKIIKEFNNEFFQPQLERLLLNFLGVVDPSAGGLVILTFFVFRRAIQLLGTAKHAKFYESVTRGEIIGTLCLTEIGHGSNMKMFQTTATYNNDKEEFVINTPHFVAAKCWSESLGQIATHVIIYAQLFMEDGTSYGLHPFVVPIRNLQTLLPYPGVIVSSLGEKVGFNGADHGFLAFNNYRVSKECLLNKFVDITAEGEYIIVDNEQRDPLAAVYGMLFATRIDTICFNLMFSQYAVTIAARFGRENTHISIENKNSNFIPKIHNQYRLLSYISVYYVTEMFTKHLRQVMDNYVSLSTMNAETLSRYTTEINLVCSSSKSLLMTLIRDSTSECLEACKEHAYLEISALGSIKYICEVGCTVEGATEVLMQQASGILIQIWKTVLKQQEIKFPINSVNFLHGAFEILNLRFSVSSLVEFLKVKNILMCYKWLTCYLLKKSYDKRQKIFSEQKTKTFWVMHESQVYHCKELTYAYIEHYIIQEVSRLISKSTDETIKSILNKLLMFYGLWSLQKYTSFFYQGGYTTGPQFGKWIEESIFILYNDLKDITEELANVISLPNSLSFSVLSNSKENIFKQMESSMRGFSTPHWTKEVKMTNINSKL